MKILHILEDFSTASGGLRTVVKNLNESLNKNGIESFIISAGIDQEDQIYKRVDTDNPWCYSKQWEASIAAIFKRVKIDIIHIHGVWMFPQYLAAKYAIKNKVPFVVTPHGMYEPWLWAQSKFKKKVYFTLLTKKKFSKATVIHAITEEEKENLKLLFPDVKVKIIPNLIHKKQYHVYDGTQGKYVLFVGRIDKKKGIDILIKSFAKLNLKDVKLKIAGKLNDYKLELDQLIKFLRIQDKVEFLGMIKDQIKEDVYKNAFIFVAPSYSEVIGMVNLEAAIYGVPVITTFQTGIKKEWGNYGGMLINPLEGELHKALQLFVNMNVEERNDKGKQLYEFVLNEYCWDSKLNDWKMLYKNLI
tara:strand:- start:2815 stop:3891 length:1077 start_codon:yes stop_codon:yes gene_type:complete